MKSREQGGGGMRSIDTMKTNEQNSVRGGGALEEADGVENRGGPPKEKRGSNKKQ